MKYIHEMDKLRIDEPCAITLGKFDGFHRGHQKLLRDVLFAKEKGLKSVVLSFDFSCFPASSARQVLMTRKEKEEYLRNLGIDYFIELPFTKEVAGIEALDFVKDILVNRLSAKEIVCGTDFCFGHQRRGNVAFLEELSKELPYTLTVEKKEWDMHREISSTFIREEVAAGRMENATRLLGYPYSFSGEVIHGNALGRTLDFPTINILPEEHKIIPPYGVYFSHTWIDGEDFYGITNIGVKPTVSKEGQVNIETHLFDVEKDLYGKQAKVQLLQYLRPEMKFDSLDSLKNQLKKDLKVGKQVQISIGID